MEMMKGAIYAPVHHAIGSGVGQCRVFSVYRERATKKRNATHKVRGPPPDNISVREAKNPTDECRSHEENADDVELFPGGFGDVVDGVEGAASRGQGREEEPGEDRERDVDEGNEVEEPAPGCEKQD